MTEPLDRVCATLRSYRYTTSGEKELQNAISVALATAGIDHEREVVLDKWSRIDFLAAGVGIEVKVGSTATDVLRQLMRYAKHDQVEALCLCTTRSKHLGIAAGDSALLGKPLRVVFIGGLA